MYIRPFLRSSLTRGQSFLIIFNFVKELRIVREFKMAKETARSGPVSLPSIETTINAYVQNHFNVTDVFAVPTSFIDLLVPNPNTHEFGMFNHRPITESRAPQIAAQVSSTMLETSLKLVVTLATAGDPVGGHGDKIVPTLFPKKGCKVAMLPETEELPEPGEENEKEEDNGAEEEDEKDQDAGEELKSTTGDYLNTVLRQIDEWSGKYDLTSEAGRKSFYVEVLSKGRSDSGSDLRSYDYLAVKAVFQQSCSVRVHPVDGQHRLYTIHQLLSGNLKNGDKKWLKKRTRMNCTYYMAKDDSIKVGDDMYRVFQMMSMNLTVGASSGEGLSPENMINLMINQVSRLKDELYLTGQTFYNHPYEPKKRKNGQQSYVWHMKRTRKIASGVFDTLNFSGTDASVYRDFKGKSVATSPASGDRAAFLELENLEKIDLCRYRYDTAMRNSPHLPAVYTSQTCDNHVEEITWTFKNELVYLTKFLGRAFVSKEYSDNVRDFLQSNKNQITPRLLELIVFVGDDVYQQIKTFLLKTKIWTKYIQTSKLALIVTASLQDQLVRSIGPLMESGLEENRFFHQDQFCSFLTKTLMLDTERYASFYERTTNSDMVHTVDENTDAGTDAGTNDSVVNEEVASFQWKQFTMPVRRPNQEDIPKNIVEAFLFCYPLYIESILKELSRKNNFLPFETAAEKNLTFFKVSELDTNPLHNLEPAKRLKEDFSEITEGVDVLDLFCLAGYVTVNKKAIPFDPVTVIKHLINEEVEDGPENMSKNTQFGILHIPKQYKKKKEKKDGGKTDEEENKTVMPPKNIRQTHKRKNDSSINFTERLNKKQKTFSVAEKEQLQRIKQAALKRAADPAQEKGFGRTEKEVGVSGPTLSEKVITQNDSKEEFEKKIVPVHNSKASDSIPLGGDDGDFVMEVWVGKEADTEEDENHNAPDHTEAILQNPVFTMIEKTRNKNELINLFFKVYRDADNVDTIKWEELIASRIDVIRDRFKKYVGHLISEYLHHKGNSAKYAQDNIFGLVFRKWYNQQTREDFKWRERVLLMDGEDGAVKFELKRNEQTAELSGLFFGFNVKISGKDIKP